MAELLQLKTVSTFCAPNKLSFDLLATDDLSEFFIDLEQLATSMNSKGSLLNGAMLAGEIDGSFKAQREVLFSFNETYVASLEDVCTYGQKFGEDFKRVFPMEIFTAITHPFPVCLTTLENPQPELNFFTDEENPDERIYIYRFEDTLLINLNNINHLLTGEYEPWSPELINAVLETKQFVYCCDEYEYFCPLVFLSDGLDLINNEQAKALKKRFDEQVFMNPTPGYSKRVNFKFELYHSEPWDEGVFEIYKGVGFAQNKFFASIKNLADLLTDKNYFGDDALSLASRMLGNFVDENRNEYCRLDYVDSVLRHYLALRWNGKNETNVFIQHGWRFIRWFRDFLPEFFKMRNLDFNLMFGQFNCACFYEEDTEYDLTSPKVLIDRLAQRVGIDGEVLKQFILDLREKNFLNQQAQLKKYFGE